MHRLLIADSDDGFLMAVEEVLSADFEIQTCQDGETALELLSTFQPQVLIINLHLPFLDGLTVLRLTAYTPPVIIAIAAYLNRLIEKACQDVKVSYLMTTPYLSALRTQAINLVNQWEAKQSPMNLTAQTVQLLHDMGFPTHRVGYRQLRAAIPMYYRDRDQCLDTVLYAELARMFNKSSGQTVERSMRDLIKMAWEQRNELIWSKFFPNHKECPSNKVFFDALADHLKE